MGRLAGSQGVKGWAYRIPRGQGMGLQGPRGSKGWAYRVPEVKGVGYRVSGG